GRIVRSYLHRFVVRHRIAKKAITSFDLKPSYFGIARRVVRWLRLDEVQEHARFALVDEQPSRTRSASTRRGGNHGTAQVFERSRTTHRCFELTQKRQIGDAMLELFLRLDELHVFLNDRKKQARVVDRDRGLRRQRRE